MRSKYIVIEGLEGAGKTTARNVVVDTLTSLGVADMVFTREPGGTQLAEKLRSLVLDIKSVGDEVITDKAEVLMFYAARVQLVETVIKPALAEGNGCLAIATISQPRRIRAGAGVSIRPCWLRFATRFWAISVLT